MTPHRPWVAADLHFSASKYVLLKCGCHHNNCWKAMQCGSVIKQLQRGEGQPLACPASPAHAAECTTYSPWVVYFLDIVQHYLPGVHVIWDWRDVPGLHHFHFDATLISPHAQHAARRCEIDGPCHFNVAQGHRRHQDMLKDAVAQQNGLGLLRLHMHDWQTWPQAIVNFWWQGAAHPLYTSSYAPLLPAVLQPFVLP